MLASGLQASGNELLLEHDHAIPCFEVGCWDDIRDEDPFGDLPGMLPNAECLVQQFLFRPAPAAKRLFMCLRHVLDDGVIGGSRAPADMAGNALHAEIYLDRVGIVERLHLLAGMDEREAIVELVLDQPDMIMVL